MTAGLEAIRTVRPAFDTCGLGDTVPHKENTTCCPSLCGKCWTGSYRPHSQHPLNIRFLTLKSFA